MVKEQITLDDTGAIFYMLRPRRLRQQACAAFGIFFFQFSDHDPGFMVLKVYRLTDIAARTTRPRARTEPRLGPDRTYPARPKGSCRRRKKRLGWRSVFKKFNQSRLYWQEKMLL